MRVMQVAGTPERPVVREGSAPRPQAGPGQLLVEVHAAGVTTTELLWYPTFHTKAGDARASAVPGHEFSGVVVEAGEGVQDFVPGDAVFGMNDWFDEGAMAEFCLTQPAAVTRKPPSLPHAEAASVPISALTAMQGLFTRAGLRAGERVLVHGGAGAVGSYAIQLAHLHGAHVVTTASARNIDFVTSLGAERVLAYKDAPFEEGAGDFDVVFDTVGGETLRRSWALLKPGGRMVTIAAVEEATSEDRVKQAFFIVEPNGQQLAEVADRLAAGTLRTIVDAVFPFSQAPDVFAERVVRRGRGKMVVEIGKEKE